MVLWIIASQLVVMALGMLPLKHWRGILTRAELGKWFTIYVTKVYANALHKGIKTTPLARYKEGILGSSDRLGVGLPDRIAEPTVFMLDFMPFEERTIQEYGVVIDHIYFWDDALRPWIHARDPEDSKDPRKFTFRINPRDMREIYFREPANNSYTPSRIVIARKPIRFCNNSRIC
jgi:putative transposase